MIFLCEEPSHGPDSHEDSPCEPCLPCDHYQEMETTRSPGSVDHNCHLEPFKHKYDDNSDEIMVFKAGKGELMYGNSMYCTETYSCPASSTMEFKIAEMHIEQSAYCDYDVLQLTFGSLDTNDSKF